MSNAQSTKSGAYPFDPEVGAYFFVQGGTRTYIDNVKRAYFRIYNGTRVYNDPSTRENYTISENGVRLPFDAASRAVPREQPRAAAPSTSRKAVSPPAASSSQNSYQFSSGLPSSRSPEPLVGSLDSGYGTSYSTASVNAIAKQSTSARPRYKGSDGVADVEAHLKSVQISSDWTSNAYIKRETKIPGVYEIIIQAADNQPHTTYRLGDYNGTTSKTAIGKGLRSSKLIKSTDGKLEDRIDSRYKARSRKGKSKCFQPFEVIETLEADPPPQLQDRLSMVSNHPNLRYRQYRVRPHRYIVMEGHENSCLVVPIRTYLGRGVSAPGVKKSNHIIVYTGLQAPQPQANEAPTNNENGMKVPPIAIDLFELGARLDPMSRADLFSTITISNDMPVRDIGMVRYESQWALRYNFLLVQLDNIAPTDSRYRTLWNQYQNAQRNSPVPVDSAASHFGASGRAAHVGRSAQNPNPNNANDNDDDDDDEDDDDDDDDDDDEETSDEEG